MKLIEAIFSWEIDPERGEYDIVYTSLRAAKSEALAAVKERIAEQKADQDKYDTHDVPIDPLKVTICSVETYRISPSTLAYIVNNNGRGWRIPNSGRKLIEVTFGPDDKKPVVKTFKGTHE